jgi:WD40 repeat protein
LPANFALSGTFSEQFLDTLRAACGHDMIWPQAAQTVFRVHTSLATSIVFSLDGTRIVTGSLDHTIDAPALMEQPVGEFFPGQRADLISFSPDGIVTESSDSTIRLWDLATGETVGKSGSLSVVLVRHNCHVKRCLKRSYHSLLI